MLNEESVRLDDSHYEETTLVILKQGMLLILRTSHRKTTMMVLCSIPDTSPKTKFPQDNMILGRDLGLSIDHGLALARHILEENGEVVIQSTARSLTQDEIMSEDEEAAKRKE